MLVRGGDICKVVCHQRTHMTSYELCRQELIGSRASQHRRQVRKDDRSENDSRRETEPGEAKPFPWRPEKNGSRLWRPSSDQRMSISSNTAHGLSDDLFSQR